MQLHATIDLSNQPSEAPEMEHELVRIDVVSVAKIYGFITAALVTVFSFLFAFVDVMAPTGLGLAKWLMLIVVTGITGR